jgi:DNA helicase-4
MRLDLAAKELHENRVELRKQFSRRLLRDRLKYLLVGFLIGRHADENIRSLEARFEELLKSIRGHFEELLTTCKQVDEIEGSHRQQYFDTLGLFETDLKWLISSNVLEEQFVASMREDAEAVRRLVSECVKQVVWNRLVTLEGQVKEIQNSGTYLMAAEEDQALAALKSAEEEIAFFRAHNLPEQEFVVSASEVLQKNRTDILEYNRKFVEQRKREYGYLFNKGKLSLDSEQQTAVVTDDKYNLVIAGAGAGKTEVLITRIAYLTERKPDTVQPNRILAIAFQDKAKREIEERLRTRYKIDDVNIRTFHKLGKDILEKARGDRIKHTDIVDENKKFDLVKTEYYQLLKDPDYYRLFLDYVRAFRDNRPQEDSQEKEDNLALKQAMSYVALNNKHVRSLAEREILNFFLMNKLNDERIEIEYEHDMHNFLPDFWLPKFDLHIEHWGIDKKGNVPNYWGPNAREDYPRVMAEKREWCASNNKLLVETYSYEYDADNPDKFIEILKQRVIKKLESRFPGKFEFSPLRHNEIVELAWAPFKDPTPDDILNFIKNAKVYGLSPEKVEERLRNEKWSRKQLAFAQLALPAYRAYSNQLRERGKIDFEDMINEAVDKLRNDNGLLANVYDHILVDEYQDISKQRCKLVAELLRRNPNCKLFCVGDDWQSIMGFAGSNLNFFVNFDKFFSRPAITKISTNYRSVKSIVDAGATVISNNGGCQIAKQTVACRNELRPIRVLSSTHDEDFERQYHEQIVNDCLDRIADHMQNGCEPRDILVLSRYKSSYAVKDFIEKAKERSMDFAFDSEFARRNQFRLMTVHKSKGLEAKVVFILDVIKGTYGFPCEIEDSSIYAPAREDYPKQDHKEEERRLFYVAMTRAKEDLTIYTWKPSKSEFLEEIKSHINEEPLYY